MKKTRRKLSVAENALWHSVARTVRPLPGRMDDLLSDPGTPAEAAEPEPTKRFPDVPAPPASNGPVPASRGPARGGRGSIDDPVHRKIVRGRIAIDARLDLHGLTEHAAHDRLQAFLAAGYREGLRVVLVITGRGRSPGSAGALRRLVPQWLEQSTFSRYVSGYRSAGREHGGDGALYVRIRKHRRD